MWAMLGGGVGVRVAGWVQVLLGQAGRLEEAREIFRRGAAAAPRHPALWQASAFVAS